MGARRDELTEPAMDAAIERACTILRLPTVRDRHGEIAGIALRQQASYKGFLTELLSLECDDRESRCRARLVREAAFPRPGWTWPSATRSPASRARFPGPERPAVTWAANNAVIDCGQHTIIHSNSASGGSVDLCYRAAPRIDDVVMWNNGKAYMFHSSGYIRYDVAGDSMDPGYPLPIAGNWRGLTDSFTANVDAVVMWTNGKAYIFAGNQYVRYDVARDHADPGYPLFIAGPWRDFPPAFEASIDAGVVWPNGKAYFFKGNQYIRYDIAADRVDPGYPLNIQGPWRGLPSAFTAGIDAIVVWNNGKAYIFKGKQYCRYDIAADRVDPGYPLNIQGPWQGLPPDYI